MFFMWLVSSREQSCDTLVALHCKPLARLLPEYGASKSSKQSIQGRWTPFTYIAACRKTSVVSWWNTYLFRIVNFLYYIRGPLWCIYWSLFIYLYLYEHNVMIYIFIWEDDRPTDHALLVLGEAEHLGPLLRRMETSKCCTANHTMTMTYNMLVV